MPTREEIEGLIRERMEGLSKEGLEKLLNFAEAIREREEARGENVTLAPGPHYSGLAGLMSFIPGLGQIYNGHYGKAFLFIIVAVINIFLISQTIIGIFTFALFWLLGIADAYRSAERLKGAS